MKVEKWSETLEWIKTHGAWDLLEARVSKTAVDAVMQDLAARCGGSGCCWGVQVQPQDLIVPGVKISKEQGLNVRRA